MAENGSYLLTLWRLSRLIFVKHLEQCFICYTRDNTNLTQTIKHIFPLCIRQQWVRKKLLFAVSCLREPCLFSKLHSSGSNCLNKAVGSVLPWTKPLAHSRIRLQQKITREQWKQEMAARSASQGEEGQQGIQEKWLCTGKGKMGQSTVSHPGRLSERLTAGACQCFQTPCRGKTLSLGSPSRTKPGPDPEKPQCQAGYQSSDSFFHSFNNNKILKCLTCARQHARCWKY